MNIGIILLIMFVVGIVGSLWFSSSKDPKARREEAIYDGYMTSFGCGYVVVIIIIAMAILSWLFD